VSEKRASDGFSANRDSKHASSYLLSVRSVSEWVRSCEVAGPDHLCYSFSEISLALAWRPEGQKEIQGSTMIHRLFISHSSPDRAVLEEDILPVLQANGIQYWYSATDICGGSDWEKVIRKALSECDWFMVALSPNAISSDWVQAEVHWASTANRPHRKGLYFDCERNGIHRAGSRLRYLSLLTHGFPAATRC